MAVTLNRPLQVGPQSFELSWSSSLSEPVYRIYRNGTLLAVQRSARIVLTMNQDQHDIIDVMDDVTTPAPVIVPPVMQGLFPPVAGAYSYKVEQLIGAVWTFRTNIRQTGKANYRFQSATLPDAGVAQFRVTAIAGSGSATPIAGSAKIIRIPDIPNVSATFNPGDNTVTIAAA